MAMARDLDRSQSYKVFAGGGQTNPGVKRLRMSELGQKCHSADSACRQRLA
jgi:hypothetical protein